MGGGGLEMDRKGLVDALERTAGLPRMLGFVAGSGLEPLVGELCSAPRLPRFIGNSAEATAAVREPQRFFALLDRLGVAHPEVSFTLPSDTTRSLFKRPHRSARPHIPIRPLP